MSDTLTDHLATSVKSRAPFVIKYMPYGTLSEVLACCHHLSCWRFISLSCNADCCRRLCPTSPDARRRINLCLGTATPQRSGSERLTPSGDTFLGSEKDSLAQRGLCHALTEKNPCGITRLVHSLVRNTDAIKEFSIRCIRLRGI